MYRNEIFKITIKNDEKKQGSKGRKFGLGGGGGGGIMNIDWLMVLDLLITNDL